MQPLQARCLIHFGVDLTSDNANGAAPTAPAQRVQPQLRQPTTPATTAPMWQWLHSQNCPAFKGPVSAVSFTLCLQSRPPCFQKYTSLVPSAFCSDKCQAKKATTILWTPDPSTDKLELQPPLVFQQTSWRGHSQEEVRRTTAAKVKPGKTTAGNNKPNQRQVWILTVSCGKTWSRDTGTH